MTRADFIPIMAYIGTAVGKPLTADALEVYFDLLGDLPKNVLQIAAKRVVLEHKWATFPAVAELREAAAETMQGSGGAMSSGEAWSIATKACWDCDVDIPGDVERAFTGMPSAVRLAVQRFGFRALYQPGDNLEVMRAQFTKIYEQIVAEDKRQALLPPALRRQIAAVNVQHGELPAPVRERLGSIGQIPA
jgi:hypothetical protein